MTPISVTNLSTSRLPASILQDLDRPAPRNTVNKNTVDLENPAVTRVSRPHLHRIVQKMTDYI